MYTSPAACHTILHLPDGTENLMPSPNPYQLDLDKNAVNTLID